MGKLMKNLFEHLKTKKKYNTLKIKYEVARDELERKQVELNTERRIHTKRQTVWEEKLKEQEEEIIKLKKRRIKNDKDRKSKTTSN